MSKYSQKHNVDVRADKTAINKLKVKVEQAKIALSNQTHANIEVESFFNDEVFSWLLTREYSEKMQEELLLKSMKLVDQVFKGKWT